MKMFFSVLAIASIVTADVSLEFPPSSKKVPYEAMSLSARFGNLVPQEGIVGTLVEAYPLNGCTQLNTTVPPGSGEQIVFMQRDRDENIGCHFTVKVKNAQDAGYSAAIIFDYSLGPLIEMAGEDSTITIPSTFVTKEVGTAMMTAPNGTLCTMTQDSFPEWPQYFTTMAAAAACAVLLFAMFVVYRRQGSLIRRPRRVNRLTQQQALALPSRSPTAADAGETCCICLDEYHQGEVITELPCGHFFHKKCIDPWLMERDRVCPICKRDPMAASTAPAQTDRTPLLGGGVAADHASMISTALASSSVSAGVVAPAVAEVPAAINADQLENSDQMV